MRVVIGRPVRFAGAAPGRCARDAPLSRRLRPARRRKLLIYVYEPVGAAFAFARSLDRDATVLVADFGGGTSDFSLMRFSRGERAYPPSRSAIPASASPATASITASSKRWSRLASGGAAIPLVRQDAADPEPLFREARSWHELALMKGGVRPARIARTRARRARPRAAARRSSRSSSTISACRSTAPLRRRRSALSTQESVEFRFADMDIDIRAGIERAEFESWIAEDLAEIAAAVDRALIEARLGRAQVDRVFLTGGTSFVPAVQRLFLERFGPEKLTSADQFEFDLARSRADWPDREPGAMGGLVPRWRQLGLRRRAERGLPLDRAAERAFDGDREIVVRRRER